VRADDQPCPLAAGRARDDVLGGAAEEQPPDEVEAVLEVEVERDGGEQDEAEAERRDLDRGQAAGNPEQAMGGVDVAVLGVNRGRLDLGRAAELAQPLGDRSRGPALGIGCSASTSGGLSTGSRDGPRERAQDG
jgi:hypothetical protein